MPKYFYTAKSLEGETKTGALLAKDTHELAQNLKKEGLVLIEAVSEDISKSPKKKGFSFSLPFFGKVSVVDRMMVTRNLQVMVASGLPLTRSLNILSNQAKNEKLKKALLEIKEEISKGHSFSQALAGYPDIFSELFHNMIKVGEESGTLEDVLEMLSLQLEREHELRSKVQGAMIYPAVVISAMIGIGILMLVMVVPQIASTFEDLGIELPVTTQFIINIGVFMAEKWYIAILFFIVFVLGFLSFAKTKKGKKIIDTVSLKLPIISPIVKKTNAASTVRTLGSLISAGVPIVRSLEIVSGTLSNIYFRNAIAETAEKVRKGAELSDALKDYDNIYPSSVIEMIKVGEETGQTSKILSKLADYFEEEVTAATQNLASVIEPLLMLIVGAVIGFFAISMIQPMYSMLEGL